MSDNLVLSKDNFYSNQNFAHGFAEFQSIPKSRVDSLSQIEGIRQIDGRLVKDVRVYDSQRDESVYLRLVSLDLDNPNRLNNVKKLGGNQLQAGQLQAWIDNQFYDANQLQLGDTLEVIAEGRVQELTIQGKGMSPEFTYPLRTETELFPNPEQFGIAFLPYEDMSTLFPDQENRVNNLVFTINPKFKFSEVENLLEPELDQYGLQTIYSRENQTSHLILSEEVAMLERVSRALPLTFLSIAGIILFIMLKRLIEQQRGQIGILKAFGYTDREIVIHYLSYSILIGAVGGLAGSIIGMFLATPLTELLLEFFNVPRFYEGFSMYYLILGLALSLSVFVVAGYLGCRPAMDLKPAEAMKPPAPPSGKKVILEKIDLIWKMFTIQGKMAIRNIFRNRGRSIFLFVGITLSCAVVALTWSLNELIDLLIFYQHEEVETYDARVNLSNPVEIDVGRRELESNSVVEHVEPLNEIPITLSHLGNSEDIALLGITGTSDMYTILDSDENQIDLEKTQGIILSERLAEKLNVTQGDSLEFESPYLRNGDNSRPVEVDKTVPQYLGMNAYMEVGNLAGLLDQGNITTSYMVNLNDKNGETLLENLSLLKERYRESDVVSGIDGRHERIEQSEELMETFGSLIYIYVLFGVILCFAIIYSSSFIILSERSRELASMRVLGMTSREVFTVITFEQWFISIFAIITAVPLAQLMQWGMARNFSTDFYVLPGEMSTTALIAGVIITVFSIWTAQRFALRKVRNLSLVDVLKSRE
ncbi:ABC transporter permease [Natranaerobius thermophilus]|uniref:ABC transporter permease n=1 Tax=Natranaerobius thermophilus TaxID=375929 RepID=UPI00130DB058|nr:ABC transporter permease [Natranaerobius thermophilus]